MYKRLTLAVAGLVFAVIGVGAEARRIPVDEAVKMAIDSNLTLESSRVSLDTKKRKNDLKWNEFIPTVSLSGSASRDNEVSSGTTFRLDPSSGMPSMYTYEMPRWTVSGAVSAQITIVAALFEGLRTYRLDYEAGVLTYEKAKSQMERDLRKLYNNILLAEENLRLQKEKLTQLERQATQAQASYRGGLAPELQYLQARVAVGNQRPNVDDAEQNVRLMKANFANTIGLPYEEEIELVPFEMGTAPITLDAEALVSEASRNKPEILELKQTILYTESGRKARALQTLTPSITLQWDSRLSKSPTEDDPITAGNWRKTGAFTIALNMQLNGLVPWLKPRQELKDVDNTISTLNINLAQLIRGTEIEIYQACFTLEKAQTSLEAMWQNVELAARSYTSTETAYSSGLQTLLEVQTAANQLQEARLGVFQQEVSYRNALLDLEYALGGRFGRLGKSE